MSERLTKKHTTTIITSDSNGRVSGTQTVSNTYKGQSDETVISTRSRGKSFFGHVKSSTKRGAKFLGSISLDSPALSSIPLLPKIMLLFFTISIFVYITYDSNLFFTNILERIGSMKPAINTRGWAGSFRDFLTITSDWHSFNFLRDFINSFTGVMSFAVSLVGGLVSLLTFIAQFLGVVGIS